MRYAGRATTNPPALDFINGIAPAQAQAAAYAMVYPLPCFLEFFWFRFYSFNVAISCCVFIENLRYVMGFPSAKNRFS